MCQAQDSVALKGHNRYGILLHLGNSRIEAHIVGVVDLGVIENPLFSDGFRGRLHGAGTRAMRRPTSRNRSPGGQANRPVALHSSPLLVQPPPRSLRFGLPSSSLVSWASCVNSDTLPCMS